MSLYLVTGGAGFIGSALCKRLLEEGHVGHVVDNLSTGYETNVPNACEFHEGDCSDKSILSSLQKLNIDGILHFAGQSSGEISFDDPVRDITDNAISTLNLLEHARKSGKTKFLLASSMSVYGNQPPSAVPESASTVPLSMYAVGKLASENYLRIFSKRYGMDTTALRLFNIYGPGQNMANLRQGMISIYLAQALKDMRIIVKGSRDRFRDFVYIDDVCNVVSCILSMDSQPGYVCYNVASERKSYVWEVLEMIRKYMGAPLEVIFDKPTPGDQFGIYGSNAKIKSQFSGLEFTHFENGMEKFIQHVLRQKDKDFD